MREKYFYEYCRRKFLIMVNTFGDLHLDIKLMKVKIGISL